MKRPIAAAVFALLALAPCARAQTVTKICLPRVLPNGVGSCVDVTTSNPFPVNASVTASSAATAASSLPTISPGAGPFYQSLGGSIYVQPVFGTASGGGTQVDASHGLPVNVVAGGGSGGTSSTFGAAFPGTGTAAGATDGTDMQPLKVDASDNLRVNLETALPAGGNTIGAVTQASGPWTANLTQVGGASIALGQTTMSASVPVVLPSNQSAIPVSQSGSWTIGGTGTFTVSGTVTANQGTANATPWNENVAQFGGASVVTGTGAGGSGIPRVTVSNDSKVLAWDGTNTATVKATSTSAALTDTALVVAQSPNPAPVCTGVISVSQTSSTDVHTFTNVGYICSVVLISSTQQGISLAEGTGTVCASSETFLFGGSGGTAQVPANGGFSAVGASPWLKLQASGDHLCVLQSGSGNVSGIITYADHS